MVEKGSASSILFLFERSSSGSGMQSSAPVARERASLTSFWLSDVKKKFSLPTLSEQPQ